MTTATSNANGQTLAERKLDIDRLEAVLQGMIVMLRDNPDIPIPWAIDISCTLEREPYARFLEHHGLTPLSVEPLMVYLEPIADRYTAAEDRSGFYMPWSVSAKREDAPL